MCCCYYRGDRGWLTHFFQFDCIGKSVSTNPGIPYSMCPCTVVWLWKPVSIWSLWNCLHLWIYMLNFADLFFFSDHEVRDGTLIIPSLEPDDFGEYVCTGTNRFGSTESIVILEHTGGIKLDHCVIWKNFQRVILWKTFIENENIFLK